MYTDTAFTLSRRHLPIFTSKPVVRAQTGQTPESAARPRRTLPPLALRSRHDALRTLETAFFAVILGGFAVTAGTFAMQFFT